MTAVARAVAFAATCVVAALVGHAALVAFAHAVLTLGAWVGAS
jgi:hypothetical protein